MQSEPLRDADESGRSTPFEVGSVLRELVRPRLTGSEGAAETAARIRSRFESTGYDVDEQEFTFNPWPGRFGITAAGALYLIATFVAAAFLYTGNPLGAVALLLILLFVIGTGAFFVRAAIDSLSWGQQTGSNLYAAPSSGRPRFIVMAHRDSKSQPLPLAFRGPAIIVAIVAWLALFGAALAYTASPLPVPLVIGAGVAAAIAGVLLIFCWVDNNSPGALDNASGVAAALGIAERERANGDVAFLITDAEELGLAGARAAAAGKLPRVFGVFNLDGLDDHGDFHVIERFGTFRKTGLAPHMAAALLQQAKAMGQPADRRDLPFGIPVDHIPIVRAGLPALTIMRGSIKSLRRVHRPGDDLSHLRGEGVTLTIDLVCGAMKTMRDQARPLEDRQGHAPG